MIAQLQASTIVNPDERGSGRFAIPKTYFHFVTLIKRSTGQEAALTIETDTERFVDVLNAIAWQKAEKGLFGYEIFEVLPSELPF